MKINKKLFFIITVIVLLAVPYGVAYGDESGETERITIDCYYLNVCSSCNPITDFYDYFAKVLDIDLASEGLKVVGHNLYEDAQLESWKQLAKEKNYDENAYPAFVLDGIIYPLSDSTADYADDISVSLLNSDLVFKPNTSKIIYFSAPGCSYCDDVKSQVLDKLPAEIALDNGADSAIIIIEHSIANIDDIQLFKEYCARFNIDEDMRETPLLFIGRSYYSHQTADMDKILSMLQYRNGLDTPIITPDQIRITGSEGSDAGNSLPTNTPDTEQHADPTEEPITEPASEFGNISLIGVIGTGLINGLNPCAISMFLMLLSLITLESKKIWKIGLSFALGKFIGFFLLGTLLYSVIDAINFTGIRLATGIILIAFSAVMIVLNLMDYFAAKNERYGDIKLQLPQSLRASNHRLLKKISSDGAGILIGIGMGLLFSGGEFLCTGQIYLATIVSAIHSGADFSLALTYLGVYSLAFVAPLIVLVILAASGKHVLQLSEFFRRKMTVVKLLNIAIFGVILVLTIIFLL